MLLGNIAVFRVLFRRLLLLSRTQSCLTLEAFKQVYTSLLQPSFDDADVAWGEISEGCCKAKSYTAHKTVQLKLYSERTSQMTLSVC